MKKNMNGEDNLPGKYMQRKRFYVPKDEITRFYGKPGDPDPADFFFDCDLEEDNLEEW